jgi:hypothetical protein
MNILAPSCVALTVLCSTAFAEEPVEMKDDNAKFTMQLSGNVAWSVETDLTGEQSTVVAVTPEEHDPFTLVSATTYLKVNPMAMMGGSITQKTVDGFLKGLCENFKCRDISARSYEDIDGHKAWIVTTMLELQSYRDLGIPEAVMIATASPEGYMQLFSLHTSEGKAEELKPLLIEAFKTIQPLNP